MNDTPTVFDRRALRRRRDRAARTFPDHDFLIREVGARLLDRLDDVKRRFPVALDLGCRNGLLADMIGPRGGIGALVQCDSSAEMVRRAPSPRLVGDEEGLPFADDSFDLVLSCLNLHWVNDLPGALVQIRRILKPDGLFLAAFFGGQTCRELRVALTAAEAEIEGGASPRVAPFADVRDAGNLLARAGFALPVADTDTLTVSYGDAFRLMADLRGMGESNVLAERRRSPTRRGTLFKAAEDYVARFAGPDGRLPATFEVIFLTAWKPAPNQPRPLKPGSAERSLAEVLAPGFNEEKI